MIQNTHQLLEKAISLALKEIESFEFEERNNNDINIVLLSLFRQIVELAMGVKISAETGLMAPLEINYRAFLESYVAFKYILQDSAKTNQRAIAYKVGYYIHEIESCKEMINSENSTEKERLQYQSAMQSRKDIIDKLEYKEVLDEFNSMKKKYYPAWYSLFSGAKNLKELFTIVRSSNSMYSLYGILSKTAHSYTALRGFSSSRIPPLQTTFDPNENIYDLSAAAACLTTIIYTFTDNIFPEFKEEIDPYMKEYINFKI